MYCHAVMMMSNYQTVMCRADPINREIWRGTHTIMCAYDWDSKRTYVSLYHIENVHGFAWLCAEREWRVDWSKEWDYYAWKFVVQLFRCSLHLWVGDARSKTFFRIPGPLLDSSWKCTANVQPAAASPIACHFPPHRVFQARLSQKYWYLSITEYVPNLEPWEPIVFCTNSEEW